MIQEYILDKVWLCDGLKFSVDEIRDEVADELLSRELMNHVLAKSYEMTDAMLQDMVKFENFDLYRRERTTRRRSFAAAPTEASRQRDSAS